MLKLAGIFLFIAIIAGVLGFVVGVAGGLAKIAFFICLIGFAVTVAVKWLSQKTG
jgi:uncharacterized membrane protein YtjA (UPF0391 family)